MAKSLFSVPIFFIVFRETLEAAIIVSVLLGLVEQIVYDDPRRIAPVESPADSPLEGHSPVTEKPPSVRHEAGSDGIISAEPELVVESALVESEDSQITKKRLVRKMRLQIFFGALLGLFIALAIGAAFIAVWFTQASNLWSKSEELWEGVFNLIASLMIFVMGITLLKMDRAQAKWRIKLERAFSGKEVDKGTKTGKWVLFLLPCITVLREGMEAVVFVGGVALGQSATSIPIAAIVGIICGLVCGLLIYTFASRATLTVFLVVMTNFILLIGAGLFSKSVDNFQKNAFNHLLGQDIDDAGGDGPGSYNVIGNVWHLDCCNPDNNLDGNGWGIFYAIFGWTNSATVGTVLSYIFYWLAAIAVLIYMKFMEGRTKLFGRESAAGARRRERREQAITNDRDVTPEDLKA